MLLIKFFFLYFFLFNLIFLLLINYTMFLSNWVTCYASLIFYSPLKNKKNKLRNIIIENTLIPHII